MAGSQGGSNGKSVPKKMGKFKQSLTSSFENLFKKQVWGMDIIIIHMHVITVLNVHNVISCVLYMYTFLIGHLIV